MIQLQHYPRGTKMIQNADGKWAPVHDKDPRAAGSRWGLAYPLIMVNGQIVQPAPPKGFVRLATDGSLPSWLV